MIGGVCAGLAHYLRIDPTFVRIFFALLAFAEGGGVLIYLVLWLVLPAEGQPEGSSVDQNVRAGRSEIAERAQEFGRELRDVATGSHTQATIAIGAVLVLFGALLLLRNLNIRWFWWVDLGVLWPALLIIGGVFLLVDHLRGE
jgi:phage shock protein PspC (stress-responsive transcriptional regulator)